jgi:hypothetical protein
VSLAVVGVVAAVAGAVALADGASNAFGIVFGLGVFMAVFFGVLALVMRAARAIDRQAVAAVRASSTPDVIFPASGWNMLPWQLRKDSTRLPAEARVWSADRDGIHAWTNQEEVASLPWHEVTHIAVNQSAVTNGRGAIITISLATGIRHIPVRRALGSTQGMPAAGAARLVEKLDQIRQGSHTRSLP